MVSERIFERTLLRFLEPIVPLLHDPQVTEIMINGHEEVVVEKHGQLMLTQSCFESEEALYSAIRNIAQYVGRTIDEKQPILEGRLPDGSRATAIIAPASPERPLVSIRKFSLEEMSLARLVQLQALNSEAAEFLAAAVAIKQNILVSGGSGTGKTSLLNALGSLCDGSQRIMVIEDSREIRLQTPHVLYVVAHPADEEGLGGVSIRELLRAALRMRPDRLVVGEVRVAEPLDLVQAMISGHGGCFATVHAAHPVDALHRVETLSLMSDVALPLHALRAQVASAIDIVVQVERMRDGSRVITHISDVVSYHTEGGYVLEDIFIRLLEGQDIEGRPRSLMASTGYLPRCASRIRAAGLHLPPSMINEDRFND